MGWGVKVVESRRDSGCELVWQHVEKVYAAMKKVYAAMKKVYGSVWRKGAAAMWKSVWQWWRKGHGSDGEWQRRHAMSDAAVGRYERGWIVNFS